MTAPSAIKHGPWTISFDPPPIPIRTMDWHFTHEDFDASWEGEEDGYVSNGLCGSAESVEACKRAIADIEEDLKMPLTVDAPTPPEQPRSPSPEDWAAALSLIVQLERLLSTVSPEHEDGEIATEARALIVRFSKESA